VLPEACLRICFGPDFPFVGCFILSGCCLYQACGDKRNEIDTAVLCACWMLDSEYSVEGSSKDPDADEEDEDEDEEDEDEDGE
jgi:hypothetical protein